MSESVTPSDRPERWLPIPDWPIYEASDDGRIRSIPRFTRAKNGSVMRRRGVTLKQRPDRDGYPTVSLRNSSLKLQKTRKVATLVAITFIGPRPPGLEVCHNDGDKGNSRLSNLRYDTPSANQLDKIKHGTNPNAAKTHCPQGHPYDEANTVIDGHSRRCLTCRTVRRRARTQRDRLRRENERMRKSAA